MKTAPIPTDKRISAFDGTGYMVYSDGSLRRLPVKLRGKAKVKAAKRKRQASMKRLCAWLKEKDARIHSRG